MATRGVSGRAVALLAAVVAAALIGCSAGAPARDVGTPTAPPLVSAATAIVAPPTPTPLAPPVLVTVPPSIGGATSVPVPGTPPAAAPTATPVAFDPERLYAAVSPAVVTISNKQKARPNAATTREANAGSGLIFDAGGYLVTNRHVIDGADAIEVSLLGGKVVPGTLVGADPVADLAVVKIDTPVPAVAPFGDSALVRSGQHIVAIGSPHQFDDSVTRGIISGTDRSVGGMDGLLQTDAPISPGNSGGPLVDARGEVIGIATMTVRTNQAERIAFAIPSNTVKRLAGIIVASGKMMRPYIGVTTELLTPLRGEELHVKASRGAYISEVSPNTPAARAGLRKDDTIVAINGAPVDRAHPLALVLLDFKPGDTVTITFNRDGAEQQALVTLIERPADIDP